MHILIISPFFSPNIGGVETHLDDLAKELDLLNHVVYVHTYSPITTGSVHWKEEEKRGENIYIRRYKWFGENLFHVIEKYPFFDFLYLTPYLFLRIFWWLIFNHKRIDIIHAQGLNAGFIGVVLKKIFKKKLIVSIHAIYEIDKNSSTAKKIVKILSKADKILTLSKASYREILSLGINQNKLAVFKYWIDLNKFKPLNKNILRKKTNNKFTVLFVGRLIAKKGIKILIQVAKKLTQIDFIFIGVGPEDNFLKTQQKLTKNITFLGSLANYKLTYYYNMANVLCMPSLYEEGFGRTGMEAVACGLPVVGSIKGGISEALDNKVSLLIKPTTENFLKAIHKLYKNKKLYNKLKINCRSYAQKNFSSKNINLITKHYDKT